MFMVGWSRSRVERDVLLRRRDDGDAGAENQESARDIGATEFGFKQEKIGLLDETDDGEEELEDRGIDDTVMKTKGVQRSRRSKA
jgi:hypothetical protein